MSDQSTYVPGMCNINTAEVAYRKKAMLFGIALSVVVLLALAVFNVIWWVAPLALFVPVYIGAIGYLQVRNKFCVSYGTSGRQNADNASEAATEVTDSQAIQADKAKSRRMNLQATAITIVVVLACSALLYVL